MPHFDHIPPGKREQYNKKTGQWELVPLKESSIEDLKIMLDERNSEIEELKSEIAKRDKVIEKMNHKIIELETAAGKKK